MLWRVPCPSPGWYRAIALRGARCQPWHAARCVGMTGDIDETPVARLIRAERIDLRLEATNRDTCHEPSSEGFDQTHSELPRRSGLGQASQRQRGDVFQIEQIGRVSGNLPVLGPVVGQLRIEYVL